MAQHQIDPTNEPYAPDKLPRKKRITGPHFFEVDMRTGTVIHVAAFPEARKPSYKITVDFGPVVGELRTSAQVTNYNPEELLGRTVIGALNLGTRRIAGFESQFLILGALSADGTVNLIAPDRSVANGSVIA